MLSPGAADRHLSARLRAGTGVGVRHSRLSTSMLPHVFAREQLQAANGFMMGLRQLALLSGPLLAALVFALWGDGSGKAASADGIGMAFAFDCASFLISAWTLARVTLHAPSAAYRAGRHVASHQRRTAAGLARHGAARVHPVLGPVRLHRRRHHAGGDAGAGRLASGRRRLARPDHGLARGLSSLLGMAASGASARLRLGSFGSMILLVDAIIGALLMGMAMVHTTWQAGAFMLLLGVLNGFIQVAVFSWIQQRVPRAMLGRAMSIFMFIFMGLAPLAAAITGALLDKLSLTGLFVGAGAFLLAAATVAWLFTPMRSIPMRHTYD
ncbi:MFS transporter [Massilia sp. H-1]|nr:MFS transporter [Massilia sp. H-1]